MTANIGGKIMHITLNKVSDAIGFNGLVAEGVLINILQWQIKTSCVITQNGQNIIGGRLGQSVSCDQLVELLIKLFHGCRTRQRTPLVKTFVSIGRCQWLDKSVEFADDCFHKRMVRWFLLRK
jgi:hypothetical protein